MTENNKKLRVIVWDCESAKVIHDTMGDVLVGGMAQGKDLCTIFTGYGPRVQFLALLNAMKKALRDMKRKIKKENNNG